MIYSVLNKDNKQTTSMQISGEFQAQLQSIEAYAEGVDSIKLGRMSIDKQFSGALDAISKGEMLSAMTGTQGSAAYVAIEQVVGTLEGKKGSFVLQHFGTMNKGKDSLVVEVVPDSGAGELSTLSGSMKIKIEDGKHFYDFEYQL